MKKENVQKVLEVYSAAVQEMYLTSEKFYNFILRNIL